MLSRNQIIAIQAIVIASALAILSGCPTDEESSSDNFYAGAATRTIEYPGFETWNDINEDGLFTPGLDTFNDWGEDHLPDNLEPGYDPETNPDPAGDNYNEVLRHTGREGNGEFEFLALADNMPTFCRAPGNCRLANAIGEPLSARAAYFKKGKERILFVTLDLFGMNYLYANPLRRAIADAVGISYARVLLVFTGARSVPDTYGLWDIEFDTRWVKTKVYTAAIEAAKQAVKNSSEVRIKSAYAAREGCIDSVSGELKNFRQCNFPMYDDWKSYVAPVEPGDYDLGFMLIDDRDPILPDPRLRVVSAIDGSGTAKVTLVNWGGRPEARGGLSKTVSSDYPYYLRRAIEEKMGGIAIFLPGALEGQSTAKSVVPYRDEAGEPRDDIRLFDIGEASAAVLEAEQIWRNALPLNMGEALIYRPSAAKARSIGYYLAEKAVEAIEQTEFPDEATLEVKIEDHEIIIQNNTFVEYHRRERKSPDFEAEFDSLINLSYCLIANTGCMRTQLALVYLGRTQIFTAPGEFHPDYILGRKQMVGFYTTLRNSTGDCQFAEGRWKDRNFRAMTSLEQVAYDPQRDGNPYVQMVVGSTNVYSGNMIRNRDHNDDPCHPNYFEELISPYINWGDSVFNHLKAMAGGTQLFSAEPYYPWQSSYYEEGYIQPPY